MRWNSHVASLNLPYSPPGAMPPNPPFRLFSPMVFASHDADYTMWGEGMMATNGTKYVAETGDPRMLQNELKAQMATGAVCGQATSGPVLGGMGTTYVGLEFSTHCHFLSSISMLAPSPDWFVGGRMIDMCDHSTGMWKSAFTVQTMFPYDAGTDSGMYFNSSDSATMPPTPIERILCGTNFCSGSGQVGSLGGLVIRKATRSPSMSPSKPPSGAPTQSPIIGVSVSPTGPPVVAVAPGGSGCSLDALLSVLVSLVAFAMTL